MATNAPNTTATPAMNPAKKLSALARGFSVNSTRIAGMMLSGEMVTTKARVSISPTTIFTECSLRHRATEANRSATERWALPLASGAGPMATAHHCRVRDGVVGALRWSAGPAPAISGIARYRQALTVPIQIRATRESQSPARRGGSAHRVGTDQEQRHPHVRERQCWTASRRHAPGMPFRS